MRDWLGKRLDELAPKGKSRSGLARHLKVNPSAVSNLIAGTRKIQAPEIDKIADYLEWSRDDLLAVESGKPPPPPQSAAVFNESLTPLEYRLDTAENGGSRETVEGVDVDLTKKRIKRWLAGLTAEEAAAIVDDVIDEMRCEELKASKQRPPNRA